MAGGNDWHGTGCETNCECRSVTSELKRGHEETTEARHCKRHDHIRHQRWERNVLTLQIQSHNSNRSFHGQLGQDKHMRILESAHTSQNFQSSWLSVRRKPPGARMSKYSPAIAVTSALGDTQLSRYSLHIGNGSDSPKNVKKHMITPRCKSSRSRSIRFAPYACPCCH